MFSKDSYSKDAELQFRIAASKNDTATLIKLKNRVNINSSGTESKQTAVHRAAAGGHIEALQLLFNLGADFSSCDKDGRKPRDLAKTDEVKKLFLLIDEGYAAMEARKSFFIKTDSECSAEERISQEKDWDLLHEQINQQSTYQIAITQSFNTEIRSRKLTPEEIKQFPVFAQKQQSCMIHFKYMAAKLAILNAAITSPHKICSCGEAAAVSFVWLALFKNVDFSVEELNLASIFNINKGHALLILNRDQSMPIRDYRGWKNSLFIDPYFNRIFFFNFVSQYHQDTCIKVVDRFNLIIGASNAAPSFPTEILLQKSIASYHKVYEQLCNDIRATATKYFPLLADQPEEMATATSNP